MAHNLCVEKGDRHNNSDETAEADICIECARRIADWLGAPDAQLDEIFAEASVPDEQRATGVDLRDYFMAHAPAAPQPWFVPQLPPHPAPRWVSEDGAREYKTHFDAERAEGFDGFVNANSRALETWERTCLREKYTQWPAAWADAMLKARMK